MNETRIPLIGENAPEFIAESTMGTINFPKDFKGKWVVLFSHPGDFTPVCTTEFMGFQERMKDFKDRNVQLLGYSVDGVQSHLVWLNDIKEKFGMEITFPVIADSAVGQKYGMIHPEASSNATVRAVFFINPEGKIAAMMYYPMSNGRNIDEIVRLIDSLQFSHKYGRATPANWPINSIFGDEVIIPAATTEKQKEINVKKYKPKTWYLCTEKMPTRLGFLKSSPAVKKPTAKKATAKKPIAKKTPVAKKPAPVKKTSTAKKTTK